MGRINRHGTWVVVLDDSWGTLKAFPAGLPGFEPRRAVLETAMLPLHHRPRWTGSFTLE